MTQAEKDLRKILCHIRLNMDKEDVQSDLRNLDNIEDVFKSALVDDTINWVDLAVELRIIYGPEDCTKMDVLHVIRRYIGVFLKGCFRYTEKEKNDLCSIYINIIKNYNDNDGWINGADLFVKAMESYVRPTFYNFEITDELCRKNLIQSRKPDGINVLGFKRYNVEYRYIPKNSDDLLN